MKHLLKFIDDLVPDSLKKDEYTHRKARIFVYILLVSITTGISLKINALIIGHDEKVPLLTAVLFVVALLWFFKKKGNMVLAGNILASIWFLPIAQYIPITGGLQSDNILWLIVVPLVALLFASRMWGFVWLGIVMSYVYSIYLLQINGTIIPLRQEQFDYTYYTSSYLILFAILFGIVCIFEYGQQLIIKMLNTHKDLLRTQKMQLEQQKKELEESSKEIEAKNLILKNVDDKLRSSISELENFAYAASHDLKEPLRMIGMYTQITRKKLDPILDDSSKEYMYYVTDGVSRMQKMLDDLLQYSRLGRQKDDDRPIDLNNVLFSVIHNLTMTMRENEAAIITEELPTVTASNTEMTQLFQNLIANAIKFRKKEENPRVEIRVSDCGAYYEFELADNGIGIPERFKERVFNIFERLHSRNEYEGSGIGLATCKKIINTSGGKIWLESEEGIGTKFHFTLPKVA